MTPRIGDYLCRIDECNLMKIVKVKKTPEDEYFHCTVYDGDDLLSGYLIPHRFNQIIKKELLESQLGSILWP